jgi:hypothetical protein
MQIETRGGVDYPRGEASHLNSGWVVPVMPTVPAGLYRRSMPCYAAGPVPAMLPVNGSPLARLTKQKYER